MDEANDDDAAMMAMMGVSGFGTTKVCILPMSIIPKRIEQCYRENM